MKKEKLINAKLSWRRDDIERRFGFEGARFGKASALPTAILAAIATVLIYVALLYVPDAWSDSTSGWRKTFFAIKAILTERGWTQYAVVALGAWTFFMLWVKTRKIKLQRKPLELPVLPNDRHFVLTVGTVDQVIEQIARNADSPKDFLVYRRIVQVLSNLRNLGGVSDVDALFKSQAEQDENITETGYSLISGFLWAIPILGFIGTVMGLSSAIGNFAGALNPENVDNMTEELLEVTQGLSTAFDTTFLALSFALALQIFATFVRKQEEEFLDDVAEFCTVNIVSKLRLESLANPKPYEEDEDNDNV